MRLPLECTLVLLGALAVHAARFHAEGRRRTVDRINGLQPRVTTLGLTNTGDINYLTNVTVGGKDFSCLIDTGSSDLWVAGKPDGAKDTGKKADINYAIGSVKGPIKTSEVKFGSHTVAKQAYLEVTADDNNKDGTGLVGLGPNSGSVIWGQLKPDTTGITLLDSIFVQDTSTPNFMTVLLGRTQDPTDIFPGDFTIGEVMENYTDVTKQPKLTVTDVPAREQGDQHFQILMDKDGLLGPDNQPIKIKTKVDDAKDDYQPTAIVDTGFSLSQVPKSVADAMYSRFDGAEYANVSGVGATWIVPCHLEVNLTFTFGGQQYPIHPLDATLNPTLLGTTGVVNSKGEDCCIGMFQPITFTKSSFDVILGMSFLRNVYALINYGDFAAKNSTEKEGDPYIQFLSTTEKVEAHADFVQMRLNGDDTTGQITLSPFSQTTDTPTTMSAKPSYFWYIIVAASIAGGLFLLLAAYLLFKKRSSKKGRGAYAKLGDPAGYVAGGAHRARGGAPEGFESHSLPNMAYSGHGEAPYDAPPQNRYSDASSNHNYGHVKGADSYGEAPPYDPHSQQSYNNPWDHRV